MGGYGQQTVFFVSLDEDSSRARFFFYGKKSMSLVAGGMRQVAQLKHRLCPFVPHRGAKSFVERFQ